MIFNSIDYIVFFSLFSLVFFLLKPKFRWILLLTSSYFFYMCWKWEFIFLIIFSTVVDYFCGIKMSQKSIQKQKRPYLLISLFSNLGLLFFFKYFNFFLDSVSLVSDITYEPLNIILPMGISFYTFQTMAYSIDAYKGKIQPETHIGKFALYVSFFPQLVAGPIERANKLLPQFQLNNNSFKFDNFIIGSTQILFGLYKKVVLADLIAIYVESIYGNYELYNGVTPLFATYLFAIQIYCDFSGYSDIAIGSARILGYNLMENFRTPYFSKSITEFWRRWHISLSSWLRDYLYINLGGNRKGNIFTYRNLIITMLLGGLWHGASWNFIIWGGLHGLFLALERIFNYSSKIAKKPIILRFISGLGSFHLVCFAWVFFRSETLAKSIGILTRIVDFQNFFNLKIKDINIFTSIIFNILVFLTLERVVKKLIVKKKINALETSFIHAVLILLIILFGVNEGSQFIYFQF
ncbi:MAG: membrane-bound O-acyltransferase family protein [Crocinitomicaceae bacterium]|nr:membrane-bound O-acyltransferase family protein [Crocinitomicaceae bacterium]